MYISTVKGNSTNEVLRNKFAIECINDVKRKDCVDLTMWKERMKLTGEDNGWDTEEETRTLEFHVIMQQEELPPDDKGWPQGSCCSKTMEGEWG